MGNFPKLPEGTQLPVGGHQVTILKYLSEGGFAHIYKVKIDPKEDDTDIACLKRVIVPDKNGLNQLRKEVDVMKNLRYGRNIVKYYDSHAERLENGTYQVLVLMELCPNKSLLEYMNAKIKTKLTEPEILKIMLDISIGIYEMHKMKLVHRDIKIENVLIDTKHDFKLCDFGSTSSPIMPPKDQQQFQLLSHDIMYQTTPQYRAPEMIDLYRGFPIDEKADIWALGCFLYKLCYYTTPFEANGDIAILHATFQFLPVPAFSGDLKNLIIIMLQENPIFRPNIVQVLMLLSKMMKIEFKSLKLEDIYNTGPYNFHALHEYQRHKQNELLKQQQLYYQQNAYSSVGKATSEVNLAKQYGNQIRLQTQSPFVRSQGGTPSQSYGQLNIAELQHQTQAEIPPALSHDLEPQKNKQEAGVTLPNNEVNIETDDDNTSELELANLDNVEERYPSLDDLLEDSTKRSKSMDSNNVSQKENTSPDPPNKSTRQQNMQNYPPQVPTQPVILSNTDLQKLTPDQFQQYHYQHQAYQYQLDQYQKQLYQQTEQQKSQANTLNPNKVDHSITTGKTKEPSEFEKKEAWERHHSKIEKDAELLVDDIFAANSKSPALVPVQSQKTNQSAKSDIESLANLNKSVSSEYPPTVSDRYLNPVPDPYAENNVELAVDGHMEENVSRSANDESNGIQSRSRNSLDGLNINSETEKDQRDAFINDASSNNIDTFESFSGKYPDISNRNSEIQFSSSPQTQVSNNLNMPPTNTNYPFTYQQPSQQPTQQPTQQPPQQHISYTNQRPDVSTNQNDIRKNANPWGDYTKSTNAIPVKRESSHSGIANSHSASVKNESSAIPVHEKLNALSLKERPNNMQKRGNLNDQSSEANLIDLEVGLDSSSSSTNTPVLKPKTKDLYKLKSESSLSGFELDDEKKQPESKHQFKKRLSSAQNPSNFNFQEEVIDFASDDENPENSSEMNRLSIRNSLSRKPKSRKSSEHKRSDSANSEGKKRLSLFGSSQSN